MRRHLSFAAPLLTLLVLASCSRSEDCKLRINRMVASWAVANGGYLPSWHDRGPLARSVNGRAICTRQTKLIGVSPTAPGGGLNAAALADLDEPNIVEVLQCPFEDLALTAAELYDSRGTVSLAPAEDPFSESELAIAIGRLLRERKRRYAGRSKLPEANRILLWATADSDARRLEKVALELRRKAPALELLLMVENPKKQPPPISIGAPAWTREAIAKIDGEPSAKARAALLEKAYRRAAKGCEPALDDLSVMFLQDREAAEVSSLASQSLRLSKESPADRLERCKCRCDMDSLQVLTTWARAPRHGQVEGLPLRFAEDAKRTLTLDEAATVADLVATLDKEKLAASSVTYRIGR